MEYTQIVKRFILWHEAGFRIVHVPCLDSARELARVLGLVLTRSPQPLP